MPPLLIGPCMLLAPLVVVLVPIVIVLWLPVLALMGLAWLVLFPLAEFSEPKDRIARVHRWLGESFRTLLTPWTYFDPPEKSADASVPPAD
jgi:hypothetical protein